MRIVSLLASGTEVVCGLGAGKDLVGRSHECDNPDWVKRLPVCTRPAFAGGGSGLPDGCAVRLQLEQNYVRDTDSRSVARLVRAQCCQ